MSYCSQAAPACIIINTASLPSRVAVNIRPPPSMPITVDSLPKLLEQDTKVKVAGVDIDGVLRGKLMTKKKFLSIVKDGFGFCSVIFGWDMHDQTYFHELKISNAENGYRDIIAVPDLSSFRRIPWEDNVPFFLVSFYDPDDGEALSACPRGLLKTAVEKLEAQGLGAMAGGELCLSFMLTANKHTSRVRILPIPRHLDLNLRPLLRAQLLHNRDLSPREPPREAPLPDRRHVRL